MTGRPFRIIFFRFEVGRGSEASSDGTDTTSASAPNVFSNALHLAVDSNATDVVRLLLKYGIDPNRVATGLKIISKAPVSTTPRHSPTGGFDRRSLSAASHVIGKKSPSPRASPRGSPRCSPRSTSPRPLSPRNSQPPFEASNLNDPRLRPMLHRQTHIGGTVEQESSAAVAEDASSTKAQKNSSSSANSDPSSSITTSALQQKSNSSEGVRKEPVTRRVSWVPEVEEKKSDSSRKDRPTYKRRHSAIIKSSEKTIQRQRSFSLDSQQQVRVN